MECQFCHKEFCRPCALAIHERTCKENPNRKPLENHVCNFHANTKEGGWVCSACGLNFRTRSELFSHMNKENHKHIKRLCVCKYCGKSWVTAQHCLLNHENHCKYNPNCRPVKVHAQTEESRKRISESRKRYIEEHPDQVPFKLNHSSKKSYPEKYFEELFIKENIPLQYHLQVSRYELDFYNKDLMKYIEIDGNQHYSQYMIKHDKERDEFLKQLGWIGMRICWSEYKKMSYDDKNALIESIRSFVSS